MKIDFYTKAVLTIIAICLSIIVLKQVDVIPNANANSPTSNFKNNMNYGLVPLNADGSINVNLKSANEIEVDITSVSYGNIPVNIKNNYDK